MLAKLKETLIETTFSPNRAIDDNIDELDLGVFHEGIQETLNHPALKSNPLRIVGRNILVTAGRKTLLASSFEAPELVDYAPRIKDMAGTLGVVSRDDTQPKEHRQARFLGAYIQAHPAHLSPPESNYVLLLRDESPLALTASILSSADRTVVLFRGAQTPVLNSEQALEKMILWRRNLLGYMKSHTTMSDTLERRHEVEAEGVDKLYRQILATYHLRAFLAEGNSSLARLIAATEI